MVDQILVGAAPNEDRKDHLEFDDKEKRGRTR